MVSAEPLTLDRACPACGEGALEIGLFAGVDRLHRTPGCFEVVVCRSCGSGATSPQATPAELSSFYPGSYAPYQDPEGGLVIAISRLIRWYQVRRALLGPPLKALVALPPGRIIDIGCGRGDLAAAFATRGWSAVGVEPSGVACAVAQTRGVDARHGTLAEVQLEAEAYDAAIFQHSLEHTGDVLGDLSRVAAALRRTGLLLVTVPNFGCWQRRWFGSRWFHLDLPRHRVHFTADGLTRALERAGFHVEVLTTSTSTVGLPGTVQYALAGRCLFPNGLGFRIASGLCILTLPFARVANLLGGGDQLHVVARLGTD